MRALTLAVLFSLHSFAAAAEISPECLNEQVGLSNQIKVITRMGRELIYKQIGLLQDRLRDSDVESIRGKCNRLKKAVDNWEHTENTNDKILWRKTVGAQRDFVQFMQTLINRDRAGWDKSMKEIEAEGFHGTLDTSTFSLAVSRDLTDGRSELGQQRLEIVLDLCSPEAEGANLGIMKTRVLVSEKVKGAKPTVMDVSAYARANMPQECGPEISPGAAFLAIKGALRSAAQTTSKNLGIDLKTGATGFRD